MAYSDGLFMLTAYDTGTYSDAEAGTGIVAGVFDIAAFVIPVPCTIIAFGFQIVFEDVDYDTISVPMVTSLDVEFPTGTRVEILTLTLDPATLKEGDGSRPAQTLGAAQGTDIDRGHVVMYDGSALPKKLVAGSVLIFEHKVQGVGGGAATGLYVPFALLRLDGYDFVSANVWS